MKRRVSTGRGGNAKAAKSSSAKAVGDSEQLPHVRRVTEWPTDCNYIFCFVLALSCFWFFLVP
jgi:hypothetical protein